MISIFGCFMVLAFVAAYLVFRSEYRRKKAEGVLGLVGRRGGDTLNDAPPAGTHPVSPSQPTGEALQAGKNLLHPYQLMDPLLLYCGLFGFAGAILFATFEDPRNIAITGLNFYGGFITGALTYLYINRRYGIALAIAADIGSAGMMLAYAVGRMGCQLAGDGDWGIINRNPRPSWLSWLPDWAWSWRYPHNSLRQGIYIPGCKGSYCTELIDGVWPTPLYESLGCLALFLVLWAIRRKVRKPGAFFAIFAILNGTERFLIELIRITPRYHIGSWNISQAQLLALVWIAAGLFAGLSSLQSKAVPR